MRKKGNKMKVNEPVKNIIHIYFDKQKELCRHFLRFQEHYECPKFKGKVFTLKEYKEWYITNSERGKKTGKFTYYSDIDGFNIPCHVFSNFEDGLFNPLTEREKTILDIIKGRPQVYVVIGTHGQDKDHNDTFKHELGHGLYYIQSNYRKKVQSILKKLPKSAKTKMNRYLRNRCYHKDVWTDETHAFLLADLDYLQKCNVFKKVSPELSNIVQKLEKNYNKYIK